MTLSKKISAVVCVALLLPACGGGGADPPVTSRGILQAGPAIGVEYRSATHHGATGPDGSFLYVKGETVSFHVGDVFLGSAPGSSEITLFTLAGLTPPTTERMLRRELDRATHTATRFSRAINLQAFLLALDADRDPTNGFDVRGRESSLAGKHIDFDLRVEEFAADLQRRVPDIARHVPPWIAVAQLYRELALTIPVHARSSTQLTEFSMGRPATYGWSYHPTGELATSSSRESQRPTSGWTSYQYDALGRVSHLDSHSVSQFGTTTDSSTDNAYGTWGDLDSSETVTDDRQMVSAKFDSFGNELSRKTLHDYRFDGTVDSIDLYAASYTPDNLPLSEDASSDANADGIAESWSHTAYAYDSLDRLTSKVVESHVDGNPAVAEITAETREYAGAGGPVRVITYTDHGGDGVIDSRTTTNFTNDPLGRPVHSVADEDYDADGVIDGRQVSNFEYDSAGNQTLVSHEWVDLTDGTVKSGYRKSTRFDADRRVLSDVTEYVFGYQHSLFSNTYAYDEIGNVTSLLQNQVATIHQYGPDGEELATAYGQDIDGDGIYEVGFSTPASTTRNIYVADGVLLLSQQYFRH